MDSGQLIYFFVPLILGAAAVFLAIILLPKSRDPVWMLIIAGIVMVYVETVFSILRYFSILDYTYLIGTVPLLSIVLSCLPLVFFIFALALKLLKK